MHQISTDQVSHIFQSNVFLPKKYAQLYYPKFLISSNKLGRNASKLLTIAQIKLRDYRSLSESRFILFICLDCI